MSFDWNSHFAKRTAQMRRSAIRELLKLTGQPGMISFAGGLPAPELFPLKEIKAATSAVIERIGSPVLQYGETEGVAPLRQWIAEHYSRGSMRLTSANVAIVSGAQQGLDLIGRILLDAGDRVLVENPTYLALLSAWRPLSPEFLSVPSDNDGLCVGEMNSALQRNPKLLYSVPNFQNPQGTTTSLPRRKQLVRLARERELIVVEDDPYGDLRFSGEAVPSLLELNAEDGASVSNVIAVGTFSKVIAPGLRVGWVIAPEEVIEKLVRAKQAADLHTSTLSQYIAHELVRAGFLDRHLPVLRAAYQRRRDLMIETMAAHFPEEITWTRPQGGLFLLVTMPTGMDSAEVLGSALKKRVGFVPGEEFHLGATGRNTFRLNFSNATPEQICEGIQRLGEVLKELCLRNECQGTVATERNTLSLGNRP